MIAFLYFATASVALACTHRWVSRITRGAAITLLLLPLVFTGRAVLTGRIYAPVEMPFVSQPLADHRVEHHVPPVHNATLSDIAFQMIPWRETVRRSLADRRWPLLNPYMFCGDVLAASMQPAVYSPFTLIACFLPAALSFTFTAAIAFFIAGLGAFVFARELANGANPLSETAALVAAIGWMLSAPLALTILWPLGFAWALLPFVLLGARRVVTAPGRQSVGLLAVALVLEILAGHPETTLHVVAIATAYGLFQLARSEHRGRAFAAAMVAGTLALLLTAIAWLPFLDVARLSSEYRVRTRTFAWGALHVTSDSVGKAAIQNALPFLREKDGAPFERSEAGSLLVAGSIAAIVFVRRREIAFFAGLLLVAFLAGINAWPVAQILHGLPLFNSALNDRLAVAVPFCLALLAAYAIDSWPARRLGITMLLVAAVITFVAIGWPGPVDERRLIAELAAPLAGSFVAFYLRREWAVPLLITLLLLQRTISDGSHVPTHPREMAYPPMALFDHLDTTTPFRIAPYGNALLPNTAAMYALEDVRGATPMTSGLLTDTFPLWLKVRKGAFPQIDDLTRPFLSMMNARYSLLDVSTPIPAGWRDAGYDVYTRLIENEHVLPRTFIPRRVRVGRSPEQVIEEMAAETDFAERAWLAVPAPRGEHVNGSGRVTTSRRGPDLDIEVSMLNDGYVVVSEAAWPGWRAYLDSRRVKPLGANHAFLAVFVPAGHHRLRLTYLPQAFIVGRTISAATLLGLAMLLPAGTMLRRRRANRANWKDPAGG